MLPLFEKYPALRERIPHVSLGEFPTPIVPLTGLAKRLGVDGLLLKHDGLSGRVYGGNKIRKLEFLLADAMAKKATEVLTFGCAGSNHALATALYARQVGLHSISILLPQPHADYVRRNLLLSHACGAEIHHYANERSARVATMWLLLRRRLTRGRSPYIIGVGGSSPLGTLGYVNAALEFGKQVAGGCMPEPDTIVVPMGSMGTAVGLMIGLKVAGLNSRLIPVRVVAAQYGNRKAFGALYRKTVALLRSADPSFPHLDLNEEAFAINDAYFGGQYARPTPQGMEAVALMEEAEGIRLEGTYTGKAMAAFLDQVRGRGVSTGVTLFWNTYNARDFSDAIRGIDYHQLPRSVHGYFEEKADAHGIPGI